MTTRAQHTSSFAALGRLLRYARGYRRQIIAATTCSIIESLNRCLRFDMLAPALARIFVFGSSGLDRFSSASSPASLFFV